MPKTYPDIGTFSSGQILTATTMNEVGDNLDNQRVPPMCRTVKSGTQSIPNAAATAITFTGTDDYDTDAMHSTSTNTSRITINTAGVYVVTAFIMTAASTAAYNYLYIMKNGATSDPATLTLPADGANARWGCLTSHLSLAVNDYVEMAYYQNSGGAVNVTASCWLAAAWVGQAA